MYVRVPIPRHRFQVRVRVNRQGLGHFASSPARYNTPGQPFNPKLNYVLAPIVVDAVEKVLSTPVPETHLRALGSNVDPLFVERGLTIFRFDDDHYIIGAVKFGSKPKRNSNSGSMLKRGAVRYTVSLAKNYSIVDSKTGASTEGHPWLFIHTHPSVNQYPEVPSGVTVSNSILTGDLYSLRLEQDHQIGIVTIGKNEVISSIRSAANVIPFTLALRDPIIGPTNYRETRILDTHRAAANALRLMFRKPTISAYFTGDLRTGIATPYSK